MESQKKTQAAQLKCIKLNKNRMATIMENNNTESIRKLKSILKTIQNIFINKSIIFN